MPGVAAGNIDKTHYEASVPDNKMYWQTVWQM